MDQLDYIRRQIPINSDRKLPPIFPTYTKKYKEVIDEDAVGAANLKAKQSGEVESLKAKHEKEVDALKLRHERENDSQKRGDEKEAANDQIQQQNKSEAEARRKEARAKASSTSESLEEKPLVIPTISAADQMVADRLLAQLRKASFQKKVKIAKEFGIKLSKRGKSYQIEDFLGEFHSKMPEKIRVRILQHMNKLMDLPYGSIAFKKEKKEMEALQKKYAIKAEEIEEGKKRFKQMDNVGKAKYTINFHDGKSKHKDGSDFFDLRIFKNKPSLEKFKKDLLKKGYKEEEVNESFSRSLVNKAIKLVKSPKYFQGDYTGAVKAIEKLKRGLSDDSRVRAALQTANEHHKKKGMHTHSEGVDGDAMIDLMQKYLNTKNKGEKKNLLKQINRYQKKLGLKVTEAAGFKQPFGKITQADKDDAVDFLQAIKKGDPKSYKRLIKRLKLKEVLGANATVGDYISDFSKSDAPQFKGKSAKKVTSMAIAAFNANK